MAPRIKIDSKFTYFRAIFLKHVLQSWSRPVEAGRNVVHSFQQTHSEVSQNYSLQRVFSRRMNNMTLEHHTQLLEIPEIPQLMDTCVCFQPLYEQHDAGAPHPATRDCGDHSVNGHVCFFSAVVWTTWRWSTTPSYWRSLSWWTRVFVFSRRMNNVTLERHTQLLEVLEIPQLMDTCVCFQPSHEQHDIGAPHPATGDPSVNGHVFLFPAVAWTTWHWSATPSY